MAVGGYTATYVTVYHGEAMAGSPAARSSIPSGSSSRWWSASRRARVAAAIAGLAVGIPSLRLKGDYLAIVTLGFGEIIRVIILNIPAVGGATGFTDAIPITNFFWIFAMARHDDRDRPQHRGVHLRPRAGHDPRRRDRRRGDGRQHDALQGPGVRRSARRWPASPAACRDSSSPIRSIRRT